METIRLLLLNRGLVMERYITFEKNINDIISNKRKGRHKKRWKNI